MTDTTTTAPQYTAHSHYSETTDATVYTVTGPEVTGAISISFALTLHTPGPTVIRFGYGIQPTTPARRWPNPLTIHGTELAGHNYALHLSAIPDFLTGGAMQVRCASDPDSGRSDIAPVDILDTALPLLTALFNDYATRPDLPDIWQSSIRAAAIAEIPATQQRLDDRREAVATALRDLQATQDRAAHLQRLATGDELPTQPFTLLGN